MCTLDTDKIYLTWRKDVDRPRHIIGILQRDNNNYSFMYSEKNVAIAAQEDDFTYYPAFNEINKVYTDNVLEIFKRRLLNPQRRDYDDFLNYWGAIGYKEDTFSLLGLTGAKLLTDNFEFIAPHEECPARFNTDVSWLNTKSKYVVDKIRQLTNKEIEERLSLKQEPENSYDDKAVKVLFEQELLGYLKSIHCENVFNAINKGKMVRTQVANIIKNGTIKEVLLRINID
ncbi:hypothetical protein DBY21_10015 [Candidatus Gastranaerophilales bacterium]|nr:MAG: hypothetical protein DBY21_10015 [Candidatus Gastranaerophilales bacterium]